ncbi:NAAT family transporter [bacterium]|nr:NAAT family transporter [bacterium]
MPTSILSIAFALFILMDSFGNIPIYLSVLKDVDKNRKVWIIFREMIISLVIIIIFAIFGNNFFSFIGISQKSMQIAGGIVLFILAINMIFPRKNGDAYGVEGEPFIFPLAVPLMAGPAVIAAVMIYAHQNVSEMALIAAVTIAWAASSLILLLAGHLARWMDKRGLAALERMMGLILIMIAIEMFLSGWYCEYDGAKEALTSALKFLHLL